MPNKYLDSVQLGRLITKIKSLVSTTAAGYLPLTGGTITGNLSVSGTITGDVTGDVTGNADTATTATTATNATNATNDANGNPIASTYLPLSGGTMTGAITSSVGIVAKKSTDDSYIQLNSGTATANGASLVMCGKDYSGAYGAGTFVLNAKDANTNKALVGKTDGTLTWGGTNLLVPSINIKAGTTSAITVSANSSGTVSVSFGITFPSTPKVVACCSIGYQGTYASVTAVSATSCTIRLTNTSSSSYSLKADWIAISI